MYGLAFVGTIGAHGQSDIAIDNVDLSYDPTVCTDNAAFSAGSGRLQASSCHLTIVRYGHLAWQLHGKGAIMRFIWCHVSGILPFDTSSVHFFELIL
jgi:hypothetical protein